MNGILIPKPMLGRQLKVGHPFARGLVGCWLFNEGGGGKVFDLSGNRNIGSLVADTHFVPGKFGPALSFDGANDIVRTADLVPALEVANVTMIACAKSSDWNRQQVVAWKHHSAGSNQNYYIRPKLNKIAIGAYINSASAVTGDVVLTNNKRYQLAMSYDGFRLKAYVNGVFDRQSAEVIGSLRTGTKKLCFGAKDDLGDDFLGEIDYVMIWNRALVASEIFQLYLDPFYMFEREPIELWAAAASVAAEAAAERFWFNLSDRPEKNCTQF